MRKLILLLLLVCATPLQAQDNPKSLLIYISSTPPPGVSMETWNHTIFEACDAWFKAPGYSITCVKDASKAELFFMTAELTHLKRYAQCRRSYGYTGFPYMLTRNHPTIIEVNRSIMQQPGHNLLRTLKHEVGHAIGLEHHPDSIVTDVKNRPINLTAYDRRKRAEYLRFLDLMAKDEEIKK